MGNFRLKKRYIVLCLILVGIVACGVWAWNFLQGMFSPGSTKEETAGILVHDQTWGGRAVRKAIEYGDEILPLIERESVGFKEINSRNAVWIAEVLGATRTERSRKILTELYNRSNTLEKLTGAVGLARQHALAEAIDETSFLVKTVRADPGDTETQMAVEALGWAGDPRGLPCLLDLLNKRPMEYWRHASACDAVARMGSKEAIPVLRDALKSDQFYALPNAFRALVALGDREAVPLAIARVAPDLEGTNAGYLVEELEKVTGESYGYSGAKWQEWWQSVQDTWQIPAEFAKPWDEQVPVY